MRDFLCVRRPVTPSRSRRLSTGCDSTPRRSFRTRWPPGSISTHASTYEAEAQARRTIELFPDALQPHFVLGWAVWRQGRAEEAVAAFEKALSLSREALSLSFLGARLRTAWPHRGSLTPSPGTRSALQRRVMLHRSRLWSSTLALAILDAAFGWLETAYQLRG